MKTEKDYLKSIDKHLAVIKGTLWVVCFDLGVIIGLLIVS